MTAKHGLTQTELVARMQMALSEAGYPSPKYHFIDDDGDLMISSEVPDEVIYRGWQVCTGTDPVICLACFSTRVLREDTYDMLEPCTHL